MKKIARKLGYNYASYEVEIWKECEKAVVFYTRLEDNTIDIYKYIKFEENVEFIEKITNNGNIKEEWINIERITDQDIYYTISEEDSVIYYRYDRNAKYKELIYSGNIYFSLVLNSRYLLAAGKMDENNNYDLYLIDIQEKREYKILDDNLKRTYYDHTRILDLEGEKYIAHIKSHLDSYDKEELIKTYAGEDLDKKLKERLKEGVYLIAYDKFIKEIKSGYHNLSWDFFYEVDENKKIQGINYNDIIPEYILRQNYDFLIFDYKQKTLEYYAVTHGNGLVAELITAVSYRDYEDSYNLRGVNYPLAILKSTNYETYTEDRILFPVDYSFKRKKEANESLLIRKDKQIISSSWYEDEKGYHEEVKIRDTNTLELIESYEGEAVVLQDKKTVLLF